MPGLAARWVGLSSEFRFAPPHVGYPLLIEVELWTWATRQLVQVDYFRPFLWEGWLPNRSAGYVDFVDYLISADRKQMVRDGASFETQ